MSWTRTKLTDMTRWKGKAHGGLSPTQRTICNYGKLGVREVVSSTEVHSNWCLVPVSLENIQASNIVWTEQVKYRYYFITISKTEAMNLKRSRKMYMRVLGERKWKEEMPWLYYDFKDKYKQTNKPKQKGEKAGLVTCFAL